jgi:ElaB/YqjD/DUF883 family membrane-anchored ribosome-binding protein
MSTSHVAEPTVQALRAEAEVNRSRLTGTVEQLRTQVEDTATDIKERLSPDAIKTEVTQYVRDSRDQLWNSLERQARDNPLQAVAVGAALAYPALKLMRAMPAPLLLVGAGLLLSRTSSNGAGTADALRNQAQSALDTASGTLDSAADNARRKVHDAQDYARQGVDAAMGRASQTAASIKDRVTEVTDEATTAVRDTADKVMGQAEDLVQQTRQQAEDLVQQTRQTVSDTWDKNPLLIAGIGLGIGAFIAAAFPSTKAEEAVFGDASDALRRQADGLAAKGVEAAKSAVESVAAAASGEGLSVDGLNQLGESLTDKVRAVAERGVESALGGTRTNEPKRGETKSTTGY